MNQFHSHTSDVFISPDPNKCVYCRRKMNLYSKWSRRWHKLIHRHTPWYEFKDATVKLHGIWNNLPDEYMNFEIDIYPEGSDDVK